MDQQIKEFLFTLCIAQAEALCHQKQEMAEKYYGGFDGTNGIELCSETPLSQDEIQQLQSYLAQIKKWRKQ